MRSSFAQDLVSLVESVYEAIILAFVLLHVVIVMIFFAGVTFIVLFFQKGWYLQAGVATWFGAGIVMLVTAILSVAAYCLLAEFFEE